MTGNNGVFLTTRLRQMIKQYAKNPDLFFSNGGVNNEYIDRLIANYIENHPTRRSGKTCIKGTRATACEIVADTWSLGNPKEFLLKEMYSIIPPEAIDAAYAFLMRFHDKVNKDYTDWCGHSLPKGLYS